MTLQSSGAISLLDIRNELGLSGMISLGDSIVRTLLGKPSGVISLSDAYGKSAYPTAPGDPYYTNITQTSFTVNWAASSNVSYYELYFWNGSSWQYLTSTTLTYEPINNAVAGTTYYFIIRAISPVGYGIYGNYTGVTTLPLAPGVPGTPTYTNVTRNSATLNWTAASGVVDYYYIYMWTGSAWAYAGYTTSGVLTWTHSSLAANTTYSFYILAVNTGGNTASNYSQVTTLP